MHHIFCIYSSVEGQLGSFQLLHIINKAAMDIVEHVFLLHITASSGYMPRSSKVGSSSSTMSTVLRSPQTDFQNDSTSLQYQQQWRNVPLSINPHQHLLSTEFLIVFILISVRWNFRVVLICISLERYNSISYFVPGYTSKYWNLLYDWIKRICLFYLFFPPSLPSSLPPFLPYLKYNRKNYFLGPAYHSPKLPAAMAVCSAAVSLGTIWW
jgi:hypothetical protein